MTRCPNASHIDVKYHQIRDFVRRELIDVEYIEGVTNTADIFTKALPPVKHNPFRDEITMSIDE